MEERDVSLDDFKKIIKRRKWSLFLPAAGLIFVAAVVALLLPSVYRSEATIFIEEQEVPAEYVTSTVTSYAEQRIQAIHQRIMTFTPLLRIIQDYGLYPEMRDRFTSEEIVSRMRSDTYLKPVNADIIDRRTGRAATATIAFVLSYEGREPQKVQKVANVLVSLFLEQNLKERVQQVEETSSFLESEIAKLKKDLTGLEAEITLFKEVHMHELPEMLQLNLQSLQNVQFNIDHLDQQLSSLKEKESYLQSQLASIHPNLENESRIRLEQLRIELVSLTKRFSEEYPDVKRARAEIAELEEKFQRSGSASGRRPDNPAYVTMKAQLAGIQTELTSVQKQKERLRSEAEEYKRRIAATPAVEDRYHNLNNARNSKQAKYDDLTAKLMEAHVAHGLEKDQKGERFTLVEAPRLPEKPYKPNRLAIILIGCVLGIGAGIGTVALREYADGSVHSAEQLSRRTSIPVLAMVPVISSPRDMAQRRKRLCFLALGIVVLIGFGLAYFHYQMMDLNVFWAKLLRRFPV